MSGRPDRLAEAHRWAEKADHDLRNAEHTLLLDEDCPFDTVCFHAQQCVEKYLKAALIWQSVVFPRSHDLRLLVQLVGKESGLVFDLEMVLPLNRYAVEARYPGDWEPIGREEAEESVRVARTVKEILRAALPALSR
ncbi:MAG: HEPN domain-containing protein [Thermoleophilia bacterium]